MLHTRVVIIGAGQAGLAVSQLLTLSGVEHVVLERGQTAHRWMTQRWDSLRLLTPNWMSRLPGWQYRGADPGGYMSAAEVRDYLAAYARSFGAPVVHGADVRSVTRSSGRYQVTCDAGHWTADAVVIATGYCDRPALPVISRELDSGVRQITPDQYRSPADVPSGRVLVVGASATGVQLADELARAGRDVVLAVGQHNRLPRRYRGMDIMWWLDSMGVLDQPVRSGGARRSAEPSVQLVGSADGRDVDLPSLADRGIRVAGRVSGVRNGALTLADDLAATTAAADVRLFRLLDRIDRYATVAGLDAEVEPAHRPRPSTVLPAARETGWSRNPAVGVRTVVWATGYRRDYPWLHIPVLDSTGEIRQTAGITPTAGLVVVGMRRQTRRSSTFLDGVRHDAALVVEHLINGTLARSTRRAS